MIYVNYPAKEISNMHLFQIESDFFPIGFMKSRGASNEAPL